MLFGADQMLLHYGPQAYYPPDVAYLKFRNSVTRFRNHGCDPAILGTAARRELTPKECRELLSHLPRSLHGYMTRALAESEPSSG